MNDSTSSKFTCELCQRQVTIITRHHLLPKSQHKRKQILRHFKRTEMLENIAELCKPCHKFIHSVLSEKELALNYYTVDLLAQHPDIKHFIDWIKQKPDGFYATTRKAKR